jgi:hypothetical protein
MAGKAMPFHWRKQTRGAFRHFGINDRGERAGAAPDQQHASIR